MPRGDSSADRIRSCALELFARHGVAGTSLRMIAEELGVTKAAVYYHFRSKEEIVQAVLHPAIVTFDELLATVTTLPAEQRAAALVDGLARQAVTHRQLYAVVLKDVAAAALSAGRPDHARTFQRLRDTLAGPDADGPALVRVSIFLTGLVGPAVEEGVADLDDAGLERAIAEAGYRLLGLTAPTTAGEASGPPDPVPARVLHGRR